MLQGIREVNLFTVLIYLEPWFNATDPISAPATDLKLLQNIINYTEKSPVTAECALKAFSRHLWYLSEECMGLAFFDPKVDVATKKAMVLKLQVQKRQSPKSRMRYIPDDKNLKDLAHFSLPDFVTANTLNFFDYLGIPTDFLKDDPVSWVNHPSFIEGVRIVKGLQVVNDVAERAVALVKSYNSGNVTNDEGEYQKLLVVSIDFSVTYNNIKVCYLIEVVYGFKRVGRKLIMEETVEDLTISGVLSK